MRFYDREEETEILRRNSRLAGEGHSLLTVVTGRRRIGKTALALRALGPNPDKGQAENNSLTAYPTVAHGQGANGQPSRENEVKIQETHSPDASRRVPGRLTNPQDVPNVPDVPDVPNVPTVYMFISRQREGLLARELAASAAKELGLFVAGDVATVGDLFKMLMEAGRTRHFNLIIDEFQDLSYVNPATFSQIQNLWDQYRQHTHVNLVVMGSVYSMMHRIFEDMKEPLFGRADSFLRLKPFKTSTLKEIMKDVRPTFTNDELLGLYSFTGGIPKYVELLTTFSDMSIEGMVGYITSADSPFIEEGRSLLIQELGKDYSTYFSILKAVATGRNTRGEITDTLGERNIGGQLTRLTDDYGLLENRRPILAKERSQAVRYTIRDNFLQFWFAYFEQNRPLLEIGNLAALRRIILDDYPTYSGRLLERYFIQQFAESGKFREVGAFWEPRGEAYETDLVALSIEPNRATVAEIKRQRKNFKPEKLREKIEHIKAKLLPHSTIDSLSLTLEDM